jgi:hypothetical protein
LEFHLEGFADSLVKHPFAPSMRLARAAVKYEANGKAEPAEIAADDWAAPQRDKIAGAEKILSLITDPAERSPYCGAQGPPDATAKSVGASATYLIP